jgi:hypothetical protein
VTLDDVRAATIDRALVDDDPEPALALAGVVDSVVRRTTDNSAVRHTAGDRSRSDDPLVAAMLAMGTVADDRSLDDRAWRPGARVDPLVVAGAAAAVRRRTIAVDRAADLAGCTRPRLEAAVDRQYRRKKEE